METLTLNVKRRETGKQIAKKYRADGFIPGVFYMKGVDSIPILVEPKEIKQFVYTSEARIFNMVINGEDYSKECVLKDVSFDPVTDKIKHFDLFGVDKTKKLTIEIPVAVKGTAPGVKEGGVLNLLIHKIVIHCLPELIPNRIELDVSNLNIGDSLTVADIKIPDISFDIPQDTIIVSVIAHRLVDKEATPAAAGAKPEATA